jgi:hypothetical protein
MISSFGSLSNREFGTAEQVAIFQRGNGDAAEICGINHGFISCFDASVSWILANFMQICAIAF